MRTIPCLALLALVTACATPYQPTGLTGGFSETQLDRNVFRITFNGNGYTRPERAADFALLRSADVALKNGFSYFIVIDGNSRVDHSTYTTPVQATTTGSASVYGNTAYGSSTTRFSGGQTFLISAPSSTNTIVCFAERPSVNGMVYDARFVYDSLAQKYEFESSPGK